MPKPTAVAPTATSTSVGPAILGGNISAFLAKYGPANDHTNVAIGRYNFGRYSGVAQDGLIVYTDILDPGYSHVVYGVTMQAPPGKPWDVPTANAVCQIAYPADAVYQSSVFPAAKSVDRIYFSASLAKAFPASAFQDASQQPIRAGTFDVLFLYADATHVSSCSVQIGTQQTV